MGLFEKVRDLMAGREFTVGTPSTDTEAWKGVAPSILATIAAGTSDTYGFGSAVTRDVALSVPAVRRGVRLMTSAIASMPLVPWRGHERLDPTPYLASPERIRAYVTTMTETIEDLIFYPYAWWKVEDRDGYNRPTQVVRLDPQFVTVETDPTSGQVVTEYVMYRNKQVYARDLIRFDGPDEGFLTHGAGAVLTALKLELAACTYASSEIPSGYLKNVGEYDLTKDEALQMLADWSLARRRGSTGYLNRAVDYVNPNGNPRELQLVEAREECALQISRALGLAPRYCNATSGDSMTYTNTTAERQDLIDFTLRQYLEPVEQRLSMNDRNGSPMGQRVRFNMDVFLRGNPADRASLYQTLIPLGVMSVEEARAAENLTGPPGKTSAPEETSPQ